MSPKLRQPVLEPERQASGKVQIGGRLSVNMNNRVKFSAVLTDLSKDQILEDALAVYYGTADADVLKRQKEVLTKMGALKEGKVPFESPLTPVKYNATLTSRGGSPKLTIRMGS